MVLAGGTTLTYPRGRMSAALSPSAPRGAAVVGLAHEILVGSDAAVFGGLAVSLTLALVTGGLALQLRLAAPVRWKPRNRNQRCNPPRSSNPPERMFPRDRRRDSAGRRGIPSR